MRAYRLKAHHLDRKLPAEQLETAAGACGFQNSPPGAWETAAWQRVEGCTQALLQSALYREKTLLQAWSWRGAPVVFPTSQRQMFLGAMAAEAGEEPWIYTLGLKGALEFLGLSFGEALELVKEAALCLDAQTVAGKELLDRTLACLVARKLSGSQLQKWQAPSVYGDPEKQTMGEAAVSFLLRPCSHLSLVVFGERRGNTPEFTSLKRWTGLAPQGTGSQEAVRCLVRHYLRCFGPATEQDFMSWLGCCPRQARRIWNTVKEELEPVEQEGKKRWILQEERQKLLEAEPAVGSLHLLGAHDPYLDLRDRVVILEDKALQARVWRTVGNPNPVLREGWVAGLWKLKGQGPAKGEFTLWEALSEAEKSRLAQLMEQYAVFRGKRLSRIEFQEI